MAGNTKRRIGIKNLSGAFRFFLICLMLHISVMKEAPEASVQEEKSVPDEALRKEEYEVYSALLNILSSYNKPELLVISDSTITREKLELGYDNLQEMKRKAPELLEDFADKNSEAFKLSPLFKCKTKTRLISQEEIDDIFSEGNREPWRIFRKRFPGAKGIIWLSRVSFNKQKNMAAVYAEELQGENAGGGYYYIMKKVKGKWKIAYREMCWVT